MDSNGNGLNEFVGETKNDLQFYDNGIGRGFTDTLFVRGMKAKDLHALAPYHLSEGVN